MPQGDQAPSGASLAKLELNQDDRLLEYGPPDCAVSEILPPSRLSEWGESRICRPDTLIKFDRATTNHVFG